MLKLTNGYTLKKLTNNSYIIICILKFKFYNKYAAYLYLGGKLKNSKSDVEIYHYLYLYWYEYLMFGYLHLVMYSILETIKKTQRVYCTF